MLNKLMNPKNEKKVFFGLSSQPKKMIDDITIKTEAFFLSKFLNGVSTTLPKTKHLSLEKITKTIANSIKNNKKKETGYHKRIEFFLKNNNNPKITPKNILSSLVDKLTNSELKSLYAALLHQEDLID